MPEMLSTGVVGPGFQSTSTDVRAAVNRPPFPLARPTSASWREQALSKIAELRFVRDWLLELPASNAISDEARRITDDHFEAAAAAAKGGSPWTLHSVITGLTGSGVERVISQLDAVESELLRIAPPDYLNGELSNLLAHVQLHLSPNDPRRVRLETIAERSICDEDEQIVPVAGPIRTNGAGLWTGLHRAFGTPVTSQRQSAAAASASQNGGRRKPRRLSESDRQAVISAVRAASAESRWKVSRLRSFRNVIAITSLLLTAAAVGMLVFAFHKPGALPMCFIPGNVVCTTSTTPVPAAAKPDATGQQSAASEARADALMRRVASGWDVAVVELVGLIAAAIAAAAALRNVQGTSTPYSLPVALAVLKLPTGALTAVLGLLLMRGGFVPGLSALDSSAQIVAWALIFGYAQQLLTRLVDNQAQNVLEGAGGNAKSLAAPQEPTHLGAPAGTSLAR
jgi:hypothetical protein